MSCSASPIQDRAVSEWWGLAEHADLARAHPQQVAHGADERGLARPVGAEEAEECTRRDLQVEVLERQRAVAVALGQRSQAQGGVVTKHHYEAIDGICPADYEGRERPFAPSACWRPR